ncbi:MAG: hypothetical protein ACKVVP_10360 [Chloroflexota bacterium]
MSHDMLEQAIGRWRAAETRQDPPIASLKESVELLRRLDDHGCAYGRVTAARLDGLTRSVERLEAKLNAVLLAALGTFLSTLAGLYFRG